MFAIFKKKEDHIYTEVPRRNRAAKHARRPMTAPPGFGTSFKSEDIPVTPATARHSSDGGSFSASPLHESSEPRPQEALDQPTGSSSSQVSKELPPPPRPTLGGPPVPIRSLSAASCELRNPFRSNTSDTITTISMSRTSSFAEAVTPMHRTVPTWLPEQIEGTALDTQPHKAAIFTTPALGLAINTDPFSDESSGPEDSEMSTTPTTASSVHSAVQEAPRQNTHKRSRWSFLKSPKQSTQDFLQVHIPSGALSPPARHRHAFWSRA